MLTIGQTSEVCGVGVKILRHCDKIDLLKPQGTDEINGYRYYEDSQIGTMLLIGRLERYGFSLTEIQALLTIPDSRELPRQLYRQRFRLERQMEYIFMTIREMGRHLEEFERTDDVMSYQNNYKIRMRETEEQVLVIRKHKMSMGEFDTYYGEIYEKIARERMTINGVIMAVHHDQESDPAYSDIELGVGITERDKTDFIMPGCPCATAVHKGPYSGLPDAYGAIVTRVSADGYHMNGMSYGVYRRNRFNRPPPGEWETEILFPMKKQRTGRR